ncbi:dihydrofolate reductase family protein [Rhodococcus sp. HNM0569]|uniref:dihydrofolate reductase family protein n=1 Tax=Rhodococcus sp. HNM0569 TaxID=2716340 RepID=UPI00146DB8A8|nr:dihydrofolate reductase family protein [Rhodococcus sp. HNM0569]NLU84230.1 dihydrofolate reductase family protein [Rhodococcus sp. HNM0569]
MGELVYSALASLDGHTADVYGGFDWAAPDAEVHAFVNECERDVGTYYFGRRMYHTMAVWEEMDVADEPAPVREYARMWRGADKVVFSSTLPEVWTPNTRLERHFDPDVVAREVAASDRDVSIGGPTVAAAADDAGLIDRYRLFVMPVLVGGGLRVWQGVRRHDLELVGHRSFASGVVFLDYRRVRA